MLTKQVARRPKQVRIRCPFTFQGRPVTAPNTPDDERRIKLSLWLTRYIGDGDSYVTPGLNGYTADELAAAPAHYAHLQKAEAVVPEAELQLQALEMLRAGVNIQEMPDELCVPVTRFAEWRQQPAFALEWEAAKAEGSGRKVRSSAVRDAASARRIPEAEQPALPNPPPPMETSATPALVRSKGKTPTYTDEVLQEMVLNAIREGRRGYELIKDPAFIGFNTKRLIRWQTDRVFLTKWDEAKREGAPHRSPKKRTKKEAEAVTAAPVASPPPAVAPALAIVAAAPMEAVNGPAHYGGREVFDQMLVLFGSGAVAAFCQLNAYKYRMRAGKKAGNSIEQDVSKALWYEARLQELSTAA